MLNSNIQYHLTLWKQMINTEDEKIVPLVLW